MTDSRQPDQRTTLSIRLSADGFSLATYRSHEGNGILSHTFHVNPQHSMAANVKEFLTQTEELKRPHEETNILIHTSRYTPVPFELYEDDQTEMLFYQNLPKQNNEVILCNILSKSNAVILFSIDKLTHQLLSDHFPKARFFASISPVIEYLTIRCRQRRNETKEMFSVFHPGSVDILAFAHQKLQLVNSFHASNMNDKNYYLLNAWKRLGMNQERDLLYLAGDTPQKEQTEFLEKFIPNTSVIGPRTEFGSIPASHIPDIPFDILSLILCE